MRRRGLEGWAVFGLAVALVVVASLASLLVAGAGSDGVRLGIRVTARTSLALLLAAFTASSLVTLWPAPWSKWLLRNRRYLGLGMAFSHAVHAAFIVVVAGQLGDAFWAQQNALSLGGGLLGYAFLIAMAATSSDAAIARLGRPAWRRLHLVGSYLLWGIFAFTYGGASAKAPAYLIPTALLVSALALRFAAAQRRRASRASRAKHGVDRSADPGPGREEVVEAVVAPPQ